MKVKARVQVVQAVGISHTSDDVADANLQMISSVFGIVAMDQLKRKSGPVDLLVGINHPQFHVSETRIKDGLSIRKIPLSWVAFGVDEEQRKSKVNHAMNVHLASPILSFGKPSQWECQCLHVNVNPTR